MPSHHGYRIPPSWLVGSLFLSGLLVAQVPCQAVTPGRAWSPTETLTVPQFGGLWSPRIELSPDRVPFLFAAAASPSYDVLGFVWGESSWVLTTHVGRGLSFSWPVWAPPGEFYVVGQDPFEDSEAKAWFWLARRVGDGFVIEDVTRAYAWVTDYSAAVSALRRWVMFQDGYGAGMRLLYSDEPGTWVETPISARGGRGLVIIPFGDTTALAAWGSLEDGLRWAKLDGGTWLPGPDRLGNQLCLNPVFRSRPSGGYWFGYGTKGPYVLVRSYENDVWGSPVAITANYRTPGWEWARYSDSFEMSRDEGQYPAVAWSFFDGNAGADGICVSVPTDTGWTVADQLDNDTEGIAPSVTRDLNGDVWVAFWSYYRNGVFWAHTYTKATCSTPTVVDSAGGRLVRWTLSEPAPETWWAVLRQAPDSTLDSLTRVRAGSDRVMQWLDPAPVSGTEHRIRRECVDARYRWLSPVSGGVVSVLASLVSAEASAGQVRLTWYCKEPLRAAVVSRRMADSDWIDLGTGRVEGDGLLTYVDSNVAPGRYAYRLGLGGQVTPEAWVDVPGFSLGLDGFRPNPAADAVRVTFTLGSDSPAILELYGVDGRRVVRREVGRLGPGAHVVDLGHAAQIRSGIYWIRLTQAGKTISAKGVVTH
jgi:hypothetical protein